MIKYLNLFLFSGMLLMNYLANSLPLNNKTTGELSAEYPNLFVPAGITFSIWGVIYILLGIYCILQFTDGYKDISSKIGWLFAISCILNALWIVAWHYQKLPLSLLIMVGLLLTLITINILIAGISQGWVKAAFGIYLGWICIAAIANVTALLVDANFRGLGISEDIWTILMIAIGTLIVTLTLMKLDNPYIGIAVVWAFAGIIIKRQEDYKSIVIAALIAILIVASFTMINFLSFKKDISA
jgi:tryptophan-rich sensory protein